MTGEHCFIFLPFLQWKNEVIKEKNTFFKEKMAISVSF